MEPRGASLETNPTVLIFSASRLSIENPFTIESLDSSEAHPSLGNLVGASVVDAYSEEDELVVVFSSRRRLSVSLRAEDFACPEAASYAPDEGPIVVFNELGGRARRPTRQ